MRTTAPSRRPLKNSKDGLSLKQLQLNVPVLSPSSTDRKEFPVFVGRSEIFLIRRTLVNVSPLARSSALTSRTVSGVEMSAIEKRGAVGPKWKRQERRMSPRFNLRIGFRGDDPPEKRSAAER